ncbi:MAG: hypothetical protein DRG37_03485 [Deltaproteobacteria bacterium]|nr:MAG: hypothetical protein DRG37_03485 [Deltaproteobacteria bacterium]
MTLILFFLSAALISLSGVMAPGPLTAATVAYGRRSPNAGVLVAIGHGMAEFPIMIIIALGFGRILQDPGTGIFIGAAGGILLVYMGINMIRNENTSNMMHARAREPSKNPITGGIVLSLGNPYFLVWWATVGATLISTSLKFGILIFFLFTIVHWSMDLIWCYILSFATFRAGHIWGEKFSRAITMFCSVTLVFFGGMFIYLAIRSLAFKV